MVSPIEAAFTLFCCILAVLLYQKFPRNIHVPSPPIQGYVVECQVTHSRFLPLEAAHSFTYPLICLLVSLRALEDKKLDLGRGWIFGYGGIWGHLVGLRSAPYLAGPAQAQQTLSGKLERLLKAKGYGSSNGAANIDDAWMFTMPSILGYEGINPLTVYFCYKDSALWLVVLEIHNTFGEAHVHVLEVGREEDAISSQPNRFDHQWTFPREFHVSPFNDRLGYYTVSVRSPKHPPTACIPHDPPRPVIRVHLYTSSTDNSSAPGPLKLTALWRSTVTQPLTSSTLLRALARAPLALFLTFPRIALQAWVLHYKKRLDVFIRPPPLAPLTGVRPQYKNSSTQSGSGVKWISEGVLERYARRRVEAFLRRQIEKTSLKVKVSLIAADLESPDLVFYPHIENDDTPHLVITYLAPRFFTLLFVCPSAEHALLIGCDTESVFEVTSRDLFLQVFSQPPSQNPIHQTRSALQRLRARPIPPSISLHIPDHHLLDPPNHLVFENLKVTSALHMLFFLEHLRRWIFDVTHARLVKGQEPWYIWERARRIYSNEAGEEVETKDQFGSVVSMR